MSLNRYEFEVLNCLTGREKEGFSARAIADVTCISGTETMKCLDSLQKAGMVFSEKGCYTLTKEGLEALEPYQVRRAVILAAGFGSRMMPATQDRPKPMVDVNGVRIIDTLLGALQKAGVEEIIIVGGYKYEKLALLRENYPVLQLIENKEYATTNNISSAMAALDWIKDGCYLCEADLYISNPSIISRYQYVSNILGSYSLETDDWSYKMEDGCVSEYQKGNTFCYNYYGISYWTAEDCEKLRKDFSDVYHSPGGKEFFWEFIPFVLKKEHYRVEIRPCRKQDIMEIDNYYELAQLDPKY